MATKQDDITRHVSLDEEGRVVSRRWHRFDTCSMFKGDDAGNEGTVTEREAGLLGLKECAVCSRRADGGPALEVLISYFGEDWPFDVTDEQARENARGLIDYLRQRNVHLTIRKPKDNGSAE